MIVRRNKHWYKPCYTCYLVQFINQYCHSYFYWLELSCRGCDPQICMCVSGVCRHFLKNHGSSSQVMTGQQLLIQWYCTGKCPGDVLLSCSHYSSQLCSLRSLVYGNRPLGWRTGCIGTRVQRKVVKWGFWGSAGLLVHHLLMASGVALTLP